MKVIILAESTNAEIVIGNYTFEESWSGYALQRAGTSVTPFVVPALDSGHTNITCNTGTIRFWFKPYWSSGNGPGTAARLVELVAVGSGQSAVIWSLQTSADGTGLHLLGSSDNGPVELLNTGINWQANQSHLITLDYSPNGTALFIDGALSRHRRGHAGDSTEHRRIGSWQHIPWRKCGRGRF